MADDHDTDRRRSGQVGYRQPPVEHRFKKGQSGNPKGRPKEVPTLIDFLHRESQRRREVVEDGRRTKKSNNELLVKRAFADALSGKNPKMLMFLMKEMPQVANKVSRKPKARELDPRFTREQLVKMTPEERRDLYLRAVQEAARDRDS